MPPADETGRLTPEREAEIRRFVALSYPGPRMLVELLAEIDALREEMDAERRYRGQVIDEHSNIRVAEREHLRQVQTSAIRTEAERDRLAAALAGLIGLLQLVTCRDDMPADVYETISNNHRYLEAKAALAAAQEDTHG